MSIETNRQCWACHKKQEFTSYDQKIETTTYPLCSRKCFVIYQMVFRDGALVSYDHARGNKLVWKAMAPKCVESGSLKCLKSLRAKK